MAVAALGLSACTGEKLVPDNGNADGKFVTVHFGAEAAIEGATKATLTTDDELTFKSAWENGDVLSVKYSFDYGATKETTATWSADKSCFEAQMEGGNGNWIYDALYPALNAEKKVDFGSARTQNGSAYNRKFDLMKGSATAENADAGKTADGKDIVFNMTRQTAIAYFHLTSTLDEEVVSAKLSVADGHIASSLVMVSETEYSKGFDLSVEDLNEITITFEEGTAPKASNFQLWYNVLPTTYTKMTLTVETTGHTLTISRTAEDMYLDGKLYKVVKDIPADKWVKKVTVPVYASVAELIAAGKPTTDGTKVTVTLTDEEITKFYTSTKYTNGVYFMVGTQEVQIYCRNTPSDWEVGGTISGTLTNCEWKLFVNNKTKLETWELCPADYSELTYKAPLPTCATPVITIAENGVVSITCETAGATIHYSVGDSPADPTEADAVFSTVTLIEGQTIKAIAVAEGYKPSAVASKKYVVGGSALVDKTATIKFGKNNVEITKEKNPVTANDDQKNSWTITTTGTDVYFATQNDCAQVGSSKKPATSITFTTTLPEDAEVTSISAKFGGFSNTAGTVTLKVGETSVGTGNLNAKNDVTVTSTSTAVGNKVTITVTGIEKGVKCYNIQVKYKTAN